MFRTIIERISPAPRIELFARRNVAGWDTWGNELENDVDIFDVEDACEQESFPIG